MALTWIALLIQGMVIHLFVGTPWFEQNIEMIGWSIVGINSIVFTIAMGTKYRNSTLFFIILAGYLFRIVLLWIDINWLGFLLQSGGDTERFWGNSLHRYYFQGTFPDRLNYHAILVSIWRLFGPQRIIAQYINLLMGVHTVLIGHQIYRKYRNSPDGEVLMMGLGLAIPHFAIVNVILLREATITFAITISIYYFTVWFKERNWFALIPSAAFLLIGASMHSATIAVGLGYGVVVIFYDAKSKAFRFNRQTIGLAIMMFLAYVVIDELWGDIVFSRAASFETAEDWVDHMAREGRGSAGFTFFIPTGHPITDMIVNIPVRTIYFLLSPFPWYWRGFNDVLSFFLSGLFYVVAVVTIIFTLKNPKKENRELMLFLLIISLVSAMIFSMGVRNFGTAMRHRDKFFIQYVIMFCMCIGSDVKCHVGMAKDNVRGMLEICRVKSVTVVMKNEQVEKERIGQ